jgi:selenide,water dikinase
LGARPLCAVAIAGFPEDLGADIVASVFRGGAEKCAEAAVPVVGGHTIKDAEPKYGLSVTGAVDSQAIVRRDAGTVNDVLILTKALGTGILTAARRDDAIGDGELEAAIESMLELNAAASEAALRFGARAMTGVSGDGLIGHVATMLRDGLGARIDAGTIPLFPQALALAAHDVIPAAARSNLRDARAAGARLAAGLPLGLAAVLCDAQISGGLLIAVSPDRAGALLSALQACAPASRAIGTLTARRGVEVVWRPGKQ